MPSSANDESTLHEATRPRFIGSEIYRSSTYGTRHPLAIPRVSTCIDLCRVLGWLPDAVYVDSPRATPEQLERFHAPDYIAALQAAEREQKAPPAVRRPAITFLRAAAGWAVEG